jgi:plastin-1
MDASGKVELDDWVKVCSAPYLQVCYGSRHIQLNVKLHAKVKTSVLPTRAGKVTVQGSNANISHTINEDECTKFTNHINGVRTNCLH